MATATIILSAVAELDGTNPPGIRTSNSVRQPVFDDTTPEYMRWKLRMPGDFSTDLQLQGMVTMVGANVGTKYVQIGVAVDAIDDGENGGVETFDVENTVDVQIDNTAEVRRDFSLNLTNDDSAAAGDEITLLFRRVANAGAGHDDAVGDMALLVVNLRYTTN